MKKRKKITGRQIKFIVNMTSLAIFLFAYFYVYTGYVKKTEEAYNKVDTTEDQIMERKLKLSEEDAILTDIVAVKVQHQEIIDKFPVHIQDEDNFMFVEQIEKMLNIKTSSINTTESVLFHDTILPAVITTTDEAVSVDKPVSTDGSDTINSDIMTATVSTVSMSFTTDYNGLKELSDYISKYPEHTIIESVAVSADNITGTLAGNLVLKRFALEGTGKTYVEPTIEGIDIGIDNLFGIDSAETDTTENENTENENENENENSEN